MTGASVLVALAAGAIVLAWAARRHWLTPPGIVAAIVVGAAVTWGSGLPGLGLLLFFFLTSSALTRLLRRDGGGDSDGGGRTSGQVMANAGVAAAAAIAARLYPGTAVPVMAFGAALAAATADTWASEIGEWRAGPTRLLTTWRRVDPGVDGGVSWPGTVAAFAASLAVSILAAALYGAPGMIGPIFAGGIVGMVFDSLVGASIQGRVAWVRNDVVNWLGTAAGAATAIILGSS